MDELLSIVQKAIDEKKGERALLYDFHELNPFIDHVVICSAPSVRHVSYTHLDVYKRQMVSR